MQISSKFRSLIQLLSIFLLSSSLFIYEVLITRMLSTILMYHFVFLTTSLAILGIGIGGIILYKSEKNYSFQGLSVALALSYLTVVLLVYKFPYIKIYIFYSVILSVPFVIGGMILALTFLRKSQISNKIYFADLFGSAIGSIMVILLMDNLGFMSTVFIISGITLLSALLFDFAIQDCKNKKIVLILLLFIIVLLMEKNTVLKLEEGFTSYFKSPVTVIDYLQKTKGVDVKIEYTKWDSVSRTDVINNGKSEKLIITDGGSSAPMVKFNGDFSKVAYLKDEIGFLPFALGDNTDTLIIGSGGGKDILYAIFGNSKSIDAVEINPSTIDAISKFRSFNGDIYNYPGVKLHIDDGRNFIEKTDKKYNNIYLSMVMTKAVNNGGLSFTENYIFTKEAFRSYFNHLKDDGYLSFMFHGPNDSLRAINTGIEVLLEMGVKGSDISKYFAVISHEGHSIKDNRQSLDMPIVIFKKTPFTNEEAQRLYKKSKEQNRIIVNLPGITQMNIYNDLTHGKIELHEIYKQMPINIKPTTDNKPFFYDFNKGIPLQLLGLAIVVFVIINFMFKKLGMKRTNNSLIYYFSAIGIGFMMVEIPLIQKSILFLGNPSRAFSYILFSLLISCGLGSYFSKGEIFNKSIKKRNIIFILIPMLIIALQIWFPKMIVYFRGEGELVKLFILTISLFSLGFFMGMAFPQGIEKLNIKNKQDDIPLMWGINGIMSVAGSVFSLIFSMILGYEVTMSFGAVIYLSLFIFNPLK